MGSSSLIRASGVTSPMSNYSWTVCEGSLVGMVNMRTCVCGSA